jgi:cellulose synthase/poly-beta-1,6-N-acetylglucosamine synthase-like glycosyltransferase
LIVIFLHIFFWTCVAAILSTYLGYPLAILAAGFLSRHRPRTAAITPSVTMVISAYNEESVIGAKIENTLEVDYPKERFEVLVISDGSDDRTDEIVGAYADRGVALRRQTPRGGKSRGLTRFVPDAKGEILVFSDANSMYDPQAIRCLVRHFADPKVGYVVGHQRYVEQSGSSASFSENLYWQYEVALKECESRVGSVVGGDGAIYATRKVLFRPLQDDDINDFVNPLQIAAQGYQGVFDKDAFCYEQTARDFRGEFRRKIRIVNRSFRGLLRVPDVLDPRKVGAFAYQVIFHKLLRWFVPYFLLGALASNVALLLSGESGIYTVACLLQFTLYGAAFLYRFESFRAWKGAYVPYYFCLVNLAALLGTVGVLRGQKFVQWEPERPA